MAVLSPPRPTRPITAARRGRDGSEIRAVRHVDVTLLALPIVLSAIGLAMVYSSTRTQFGTYFVQRQGIAVAIGIALMFLMLTFDYRRLRDLYPVVYLAMLPLLVGVLALGASRKGAQAWFQFGPMQFQPSEIVKVGIVVVIAGYCHQHRGDLDAWRLAIAVILAAIPIGLVLLQNDLGSAIVIAVAVTAVLLVAGIRGRHMMVLLLLALSGIIVAVSSGYLAGYRLDRFASFLDDTPELSQDITPTQYNIDQALTTMGSGGLTGKGFGNGTQTKLGYVPEQHTDFIFTVVGEEFGFVGGAAVIALYALLVWRLFRVGLLSSDFFGTLLSMGVLAIVAFQVFENIGMTMKIMPVTGITLPFLSYGGSSVIATFLAIGLVANVHMRRFS
jgi:rod shape determining protein RodA